MSTSCTTPRSVSSFRFTDSLPSPQQLLREHRRTVEGLPGGEDADVRMGVPLGQVPTIVELPEEAGLDEETALRKSSGHIVSAPIPHKEADYEEGYKEGHPLVRTDSYNLALASPPPNLDGGRSTPLASDEDWVRFPSGRRGQSQGGGSPIYAQSSEGSERVSMASSFRGSGIAPPPSTPAHGPADSDGLVSAGLEPPIRESVIGGGLATPLTVGPSMRVRPLRVKTKPPISDQEERPAVEEVESDTEA